METETNEAAERRPIASRESGLAKRAATWLVGRRVSPNAISVSSILFALVASACLVATAWVDAVQTRLLFFLSALFIQCRLLANLFDGMVAVESGQSSKLGELYNEIPDRIADALILIGAGYAVGGLPILGYAAATLALFVSYLRVIGNSVGAERLFLGPMAKPHRMATITVAALYCAVVPAEWPGAVGSDNVYGAMNVALIATCAGCIVTSVRRITSTTRQIRSVR